mgnify:CR=1 FL=1
MLSPTEILMLFYAENYSQDQQFFEGFWYYDYQLQDPYPTLQMLWEQGYLQLGDLTGTLQRETAANMRQLLRRQGLPKISLHGLRHSFASVANSQGVPMFDISRTLGHSSMTVTSNIYTHLFDDTEAQALAAVARAIEKA